jgi:hypothetical protein
MSTHTETANKDVALNVSGNLDANFSIDDLINALNAEQPNEEAKIKVAFGKLFPALKAANDRGSSTKQLIELMAKLGLKLHHASFRKLWRDEVKRRNANGEIVSCDACGALLTPERDGNTPDARILDESDEMVTEGAANESRV